MAATENLLDDDGTQGSSGSKYASELIHSDDQKTRMSYKNQSDTDDDLVIESESEEEDDTLNLTGQNLEAIPPSLCKSKGPSITTLILTKNRLRSLKGLEQFANLETLQLDRNALKNISDFPKLSKLKTLWLNNNNLKNLNSLLTLLKKQCPSLEYLSLLFNPICPTIDGTDNLHTRYRLTVIYHLPRVTFLDTERVRRSERKEAMKRGKFLAVAKPSEEQMADVEDEVDEEDTADVTPYKNVKPAAFLGKGRIKYDGRESEGNRFILNQDL